MKIEEQVLTREQMAHLEELGIDTSDASMCWLWDDVVPNNSVLIDLRYGGIPTYTIGDLIEKLPKWIEDYELESKFGGENVGYWGIHHSAIYSVYYKSFIHGLYELLCWVAENHKELIK